MDLDANNDNTICYMKNIENDTDSIYSVADFEIGTKETKPTISEHVNSTISAIKSIESKSISNYSVDNLEIGTSFFS